MLLKLAQEYARLKKSAVLGHRLSENEKEIIFTLVSGEKYTLTVGGATAAAAAASASTLVATSPGSTLSGAGGPTSSITMDAESITLKVGSSSLTLKEDGTVELNGEKITVKGGPSVALSATLVTVN